MPPSAAEAFNIEVNEEDQLLPLVPEDEAENEDVSAGGGKTPRTPLTPLHTMMPRLKGTGLFYALKVSEAKSQRYREAYAEEIEHLKRKIGPASASIYWTVLVHDQTIAVKIN